MNEPDVTVRGEDSQREHITRLSAAILHIGGSLDVDAVLRAAVEEACALTGAEFGSVVTTGEKGQAPEFVTAGLTSEQQEQLLQWSGGPFLFDRLHDLAAPLRLESLDDYARSIGWPSDPLLGKSFLGTPMSHRGVHVGSFFLGGKKGGSRFTSSDEEVAVLFASQAAAAIVNAQTHRKERRARTDLEALVETSPVGVVVFDAGSGAVMSANQEARRIVAGLRMPGLTIQELAGVLTCRRGDGQESTLDEIAGAEILRAEEVELVAPDGRKVRTLLSVTPSRSAADEDLSVVVTTQDLAPFEELERSRSEFLGMVSHELRAPLAAIKGSAATVLGGARGYEPTEMQQFFRIVDTEADRMGELISDLLDAGRIDTGTLSVNTAPMDVAPLVDQARTTFQRGGRSHIVLIDLPADLPRVAADGQRVVQVLNNLFSNAAQHSPESAPIEVGASRQDGFVEISVTDGGEGVPRDKLSSLFRKHASVHGSKGGIRNAGLGLAICRGLVEAHGGRIRAESAGAGLGTRFAFTLPVADDAGPAATGFSRSDPQPPNNWGQRATILVVDDDPQTTRYVRDALSAAGYAPVVTGDPNDVSRLVNELNPDLVLLDLMLPGTDGIELMLGLPELASLPVIFISAYGRDETIARALEAGAHDYIVKPFSTTELTARVRAALRKQAGPRVFELGELSIDYERRRVRLGESQISLTVTEFELLQVLAENVGRVMSYDVLLRRVWGGVDRGSSDLVRTFVKKLRGKLGDTAAAPKYIINERGVGYRMAGEDEI